MVGCREVERNVIGKVREADGSATQVHPPAQERKEPKYKYQG